MLKASFPLEVHSMRATFEVQFGAVERPTHRNTSWDEEKFEVCGHRWADLSEAGYGVSLLNDCKYGHDVRGNVLRPTLLRGTESPDPDADRGHHQFTYSLYPHGGDWRQAEIHLEGLQFNHPLIVRRAKPHAGTLARQWGLLEVSHSNCVVSALKPGKDGSTVLRVYEATGKPSQGVKIKFLADVVSAHEANLMEDPGGKLETPDDVLSFDMNPFEIKTFLLQLQR